MFKDFLYETSSIDIDGPMGLIIRDIAKYGDDFWKEMDNSEFLFTYGISKDDFFLTIVTILLHILGNYLILNQSPSLQSRVWNQKDKILDILKKQLENGLITFEYDKLREMGFQNGGRIVIDLDSIKEEDQGTSYLKASEFLYNHFLRLKKEGLTPNNEQFWAKQQKENPIRVSEFFINIIFGSYKASKNNISQSKMEHRKYFLQASGN